MNGILLKNIVLNGNTTNILTSGTKISRIGAIRSEDTSGAEIIDCSGKHAIPGFANTHTHAAMTLFRGVGEGLPLMPWLQHIWALEAKMDEEFIYWGTKAACLEMIKTGTTCFNDMYWFPLAARKAVEEMGLKALISTVALDNFDPEQTRSQKDRCLAIWEEASKWDGTARFAISLHGEYTVSEDMLVWGAEFARKRGLRIHIHLSETENEVEGCKQRHGGLSPVEYLDRLGILGEDVICAHSLWLSDEDVEILGKRKASCVHNINSNMKLASGLGFRYDDLRNAGVNVCVGTDGCGSSDNLDMLEALKTASLTQKALTRSPETLPVKELIEIGSRNGAKAMGFNTGEIKEGMDADICIVDTDRVDFLSPAPFEANLFYSAHSDCIESVISNGKFVMRNREIDGEKEILEGARKAMQILK